MDILGVKQLDPNPEEHARQLTFIYDFIISKYDFLTIEEIKEAFRMFVNKEFEVKVFRMLDCILVAEVLGSYVDFRNEILKSYKPIDNTPKLEIITNLAKEEINKSAVNRVYSEFKENQNLGDGLVYIYDILVENGLIKVPSDTTPKLQKYYDNKLIEAKEELLKETEKGIIKAKQSIDKPLLNTLNRALTEIESGTDKSIILRAKRNVLKDFFNNSVLSGKEKILE